ncbi:MAG TPA: hypothetical protein PKC49_11710 [Phycisphaerae bacterium]|nr:hypothetical protein [Phycisphaerae bacterium]
MTTGGWIFMLASIGFVLGLVSFCYYRVLNPTTNSHIHPPEGLDD